MIPSKVTYSRLISLPGYENEKIGIEVEIEEGDNPETVLEWARNWTWERLHELMEKRNRRQEAMFDQFDDGE